MKNIFSFFYRTLLVLLALSFSSSYAKQNVDWKICKGDKQCESIPTHEYIFDYLNWECKAEKARVDANKNHLRYMLCSPKDSKDSFKISAQCFYSDTLKKFKTEGGIVFLSDDANSQEKTLALICHNF